MMAYSKVHLITHNIQKEKILFFMSAEVSEAEAERDCLHVAIQ